MVTFPQSIDECIYFTNRAFPDGSRTIAWVYRKECPKCHKAKMGKPTEGGKIKIRAKEYVCPECSFTESKEEYEPSLTVEVQYICPNCRHEGETTTEYKRKSFDGVPAYVFTCQKCGRKIGITKKMKETKK